MRNFGIGVLLVLLLAPNIFLATKYIYHNPTYTYKDTMIQMGEHVNDQIIVGMGHGFRLYNRAIPILNPYKYQYTDEGLSTLKKLIKNLSQEEKSRYAVLYTMDYGDFYGKIAEVHTYELNSCTHGAKQKISLYQYDLNP